jgi:hypothetical protein
MQNGFKRICCEVHATYSISNSLLSNGWSTGGYISGNIAVNDGKWHYVDGIMAQIAATGTSNQPVRATPLVQEKSLRVLALFSLASGPRKVPNTPSSEGLLTPNQCFSLMK